MKYQTFFSPFTSDLGQSGQAQFKCPLRDEMDECVTWWLASLTVAMPNAFPSSLWTKYTLCLHAFHCRASGQPHKEVPRAASKWPRIIIEKYYTLKLSGCGDTFHRTQAFLSFPTGMCTACSCVHCANVNCWYIRPKKLRSLPFTEGYTKTQSVNSEVGRWPKYTFVSIVLFVLAQCWCSCLTFQ